MEPERPDDLPELDADTVLAAPEGPAMGGDGTLHDDDGPELDLGQIEEPAELVLELDDRAPLARAAPVEPTSEPPLETPERRGLIAQARDSLRADSTRLLRTGLKAAAWLGIGSVVLSHPGVLAATVGGALAGDVAIWFLIRGFELPKHLWAFQFEALINVGAVWLMADVMHLFDSFRDPEVMPFGLVAFMLVSIGRFVAYWLPKALDA